jgi:hypothetical protein
MAVPDRDTIYSAETPNQTVYTRESSATGWFVGIIVALALLAIGYLVFSANSGPATTNTTVNTAPAVTAPADTSTQPMNSTSTDNSTMAPATGATTEPATPPQDTSPAPQVDTAPAPAAPATTAP